MENPSPPLRSPPQYPDQNPNSLHNEHLSTPSPTPSNLSSSKPLQSFSTPTRKPQHLPWSHQETANLIVAYQEKWYSLKRGQLKASQWEEIAVTVAARCGYDDSSNSKTVIQCRHKIEKLRKRYRTEKHKPNPRAAWEYFDLMDRLEHGPLPISVRPMTVVQYQNSVPTSEGQDEEEQVNGARYSNWRTRSKSNGINMRKFSGSDGSGRGIRVSRLEKTMIWKKKERMERYESDGDHDDDDEVEEEGEEEEEEASVGRGEMQMVGKLATEIKTFAERFVRMENKRMEMMRETERYRIDMENKRMEMMLESQRKIVDTIGRAFGSHNKKLKMAQDS